MLPATHRFHGLGSLRHVYQNGRTVRTPIIALRFQKNTRRATYRAAVVISKKTQKSAVGRNRIRRRIYEILRARGEAINGPYDIVVTVFSDSVAKMPAKDLEKQIDNLLAQAGITT